jgi:hypothetical protein
LSEEHRLRVLENGVLRKIFEPKKDKVTGEWRRLHNEELNQREGRESQTQLHSVVVPLLGKRHVSALVLGHHQVSKV